MSETKQGVKCSECSLNVELTFSVQWEDWFQSHQTHQSSLCVSWSSDKWAECILPHKTFAKMIFWRYFKCSIISIHICLLTVFVGTLLLILALNLLLCVTPLTVHCVIHVRACVSSCMSTHRKTAPWCCERPKAPQGTLKQEWISLC